MKRRTRQWLAWTAIAVVLGVLVYVQIVREQAAAYDPLTRLDAAQVRAVVVTCVGCPPRRYEKTAEGWRTLEPIPGMADAHVVERLIGIAAAPVRTRRAAGEFDLAKIGLAPPQATLTLDATELRFGDTHPLDGDRYVLIGDTVAFVPDRFSAVLFALPKLEVKPIDPPPAAAER